MPPPPPPSYARVVGFTPPPLSPNGLLPSLAWCVFYILTKWMGARSRMDGSGETNAEELIHVFLAELQVHMRLLVY